MITVVYTWSEMIESLDDEGKFIGYECIREGIRQVEVKNQRQLEALKMEWAMSEADSEGTYQVQVLAIYDRESGWYDASLYMSSEVMREVRLLRYKVTELQELVNRAKV